MSGEEYNIDVYCSQVHAIFISSVLIKSYLKKNMGVIVTLPHSTTPESIDEHLYIFC